MSSPLAAVRAELAAVRAELGARIVTLETRLAAVEARSGPRDGADDALVAAIADAAGGLLFRCGMVFRRSADVPALAAALRNADIDNAKQLGKLLARMKGVAVDGVRVTRHGRYWRCDVAV